jgi:hypothetical protein
MTLIPVEEYLEHIKPALLKVFKDCIFPIGGATSFPFHDAIEARAFLFDNTNQLTGADNVQG